MRPLLWKRILNEGLWTMEDREEAKRFAQMIVISPVIMDQRPCHVGMPFSIDSLQFPFPSVWIEGSAWGEDNSRWGSLVLSIQEPAGWLVELVCFAKVGNSPPVYFGNMAITTDANGTLSPEAKISEAKGAMRFDNMRATLVDIGYSAIDTLSLLGCSNVSMSARDGEPEQMRRAAKRFGGDPERYRYHVLMVRPAGARASAPSQEIGTMPWHKCRGHYNYYGPAAAHGHRDGRDRGLLFGKYAGKFFLPPHVRGDKKNGVVEKDYAIPADAASMA